MVDKTRKTKKREKAAKKRLKLLDAKVDKDLQEIAKPHDKLAKDLEDIERKYLDKEMEHAPTDKELKKARKSGAKGKLTLSEGPKDATKEDFKYKQAVLKSKTPKAFPSKPKPTTKKKIKIDRTKYTAGKVAKKAGTVAKKVLKASGNPWLLAAEVALSPSTLNEGEDEAVRKRNEEYSRRTGIIKGGSTKKKKKASGGTVKNYANGGGVRKAKFIDS